GPSHGPPAWRWSARRPATRPLRPRADRSCGRGYRPGPAGLDPEDRRLPTRRRLIGATAVPATRLRGQRTDDRRRGRALAWVRPNYRGGAGDGRPGQRTQALASWTKSGKEGAVKTGAKQPSKIHQLWTPAAFIALSGGWVVGVAAD